MASTKTSETKRPAYSAAELRGALARYGDDWSDADVERVEREIAELERAEVRS